VLQQAADKMSVSQLYGNVCATTSLANATTSLANATTSLAALALRDGTDVAALALCAAVGAGGADCLVRNRVARTERCLSASTACELGWCPLKSVLAWLC